MKNSSAVEVLKEMRSLFNESNSWEVTQERDNALYQALLALEQKERLEKWLNEKIVESERYPDTQEPAYYYRKVLELMK